MKASFYILAETILSPIRKERLFSIFLKEFTPNDFLKILSSLCGVWNLYKRIRSSFYILSHFAPMLWRLKNKTEFSLSYQNDRHLRSRVFDCFVSWSFGFSSSNVLIPLLIVVKKNLREWVKLMPKPYHLTCQTCTQCLVRNSLVLASAFLRFQFAILIVKRSITRSCMALDIIDCFWCWSSLTGDVLI